MTDPTSAYNPTTNYFEQMKKLQSQQSNLSYDDISSRASELSALMPQSKGRGLYGMATDLSKGFLASANSRTPIGTGLAMGFNLYSDAERLRKQKQDEIRAKLMQMAYQDVEKRREEAKALDMKMLDVNFKYEVEQLKNSGGLMPGKGYKDTMVNWLITGARRADAGDPSFLSSWEYRTAYAELQREKVQTMPDGRVFVVPGAAWVLQYPAPIVTEDGNPVSEPGQPVPNNAPAGGGAEDINAAITRISGELIAAGLTNPQYIGMDPKGSGKPVFSAMDSSGKQMIIVGD
tara:strand:+ start:185 stop:1054 length:870 start_codon:yes stop_codon:yes gene_type:complete